MAPKKSSSDPARTPPHATKQHKSQPAAARKASGSGHSKPAAPGRSARARAPEVAAAAKGRRASTKADPLAEKPRKAPKAAKEGARPKPAASKAAAAAGDKPLRILMVTSEAHPFAKTGGLAEVAAALPAAAARMGHAVTLVLPRYRGVSLEGASRRAFRFDLGGEPVSGEFLEHTTGGVRVVLVDVPALYDREHLYGIDGHDYPDNALRFAVLSRAALEHARLAGERLDVIHAHDWQTGLVPVYQKMLFSPDPFVGGVPAVFTIHNLAFQGMFDAGTLNAIGLPWDVYHPNALEHWGRISFLKGGVNFSEKITTVSPTYAREILTPEGGFGFEGVLARRSADLVGILNGIDTDRWNPASDPFVPASYTAEDLTGKREAKRALLREVGLSDSDPALERPLIGMVSRLTDQKGFDLIAAAAGELMDLADATWVMLGSGARQYEELWEILAAQYPDRVSATIGFDERLAHLTEAGADIFLMPSRFEPCGLNQLYSLRYGTIPVVRATGGLHDTVVDADEPGGNGIKFVPYTAAALVDAVRRALNLFRDKGRWMALQRAAMAADASWDASAREYVKVYRGLLNGI